ncbi:MAG TPA: hypothetical protein VFY71_03925 [Planctomycetota bacterium]|nr:hypothetical protein [Planctomycetota bacterium]
MSAGRVAIAAFAALLAAPLAAQSPMQTLVKGHVEYVDKAWDYSGWTGARPSLPVRRADVLVLDGVSRALLASGSTAQDGSFALAVNLAPVASLVIRCDADTDLDGSFQRVRVTTEGGVEYSVFSPVIPVSLVPPVLDVGTLTARPVLSNLDEGNPFDLFDAGVAAAEYLAGPKVGAAPKTQVMRVSWPAAGTYTLGANAHIGAGDGYDDSVVLHELGHVVANLYSDTNAPAEMHTFGDSDEDPQLAFAEGYATFFSGAVQDALGHEALYVDCDGSVPVGGVQLRARLETVAPYADDAWGEADELAVACTLFDLVDTELSVDATPGEDDDLFGSDSKVEGQPPSVAWWQVFTGPVKSARYVSCDDAWDGWLELHAAQPHVEELEAAFEGRKLRYWADYSEPDNDSASARLLPAVRGGWSEEHTLYYSASDPPAPGTGDTDWYAVPLVKGDVVDIGTRYPDGSRDADTECDTAIELHTPLATLAVSVDGGGVGRNAQISAYKVPLTGTWRYAVRSLNPLRRYGRYEVHTQYISQNHPPVITDGPHATPDTITADATAQLDVTATDQDPGQTLEYTWTPLDGGDILGRGASVAFVPPAVTAPRLVRVSVLVADSLGAEAPVAEVEIQVLPAPGPCVGAPEVAVGGSSKTGLFGPPLLAALNLPKLPSTDFALKATGCFPSHACTLVFGFSLITVKFDQGFLYPSPDFLLPLATDPGGGVLLPLVLGRNPILCGLTVHAQLIVPDDPGAAGAKHTAQSNYVSLTFGS